VVAVRGRREAVSFRSLVGALTGRRRNPPALPVPITETETQSAIDSENWKQYCESERNEAYSAIKENEQEYDKQLLTLSAAFVALVISFIDKVVPLKEASYLPLLYCSLSIMCACVLGVLASYQISIQIHFKVAEYWSTRKSDKAREVQFPMAGANVVRWLNVFNGVAFASGIILSVIFVTTNIHLQRKESYSMTKQCIANDGMNVKLPSDLVRQGQHVKIPSDYSKQITEGPKSVTLPSEAPKKEK
jgi:hypothetical protein